jgi:hypothetical protein
MFSKCNVLFLQWHIARSCLGSLVEFVICAAKVSIQLTEKNDTIFMYFIEMQIICYFHTELTLYLICVSNILSSFNYDKIYQ